MKENLSEYREKKSSKTPAPTSEQMTSAHFRHQRHRRSVSSHSNPAWSRRRAESCQNASLPMRQTTFRPCRLSCNNAQKRTHLGSKNLAVRRKLLSNREFNSTFLMFQKCSMLAQLRSLTGFRRKVKIQLKVPCNNTVTLSWTRRFVIKWRCTRFKSQ